MLPASYFYTRTFAPTKQEIDKYMKKIEPMVRTIINDFRTGKRDKVSVWMEKNGRTAIQDDYYHDQRIMY